MSDKCFIHAGVYTVYINLFMVVFFSLRKSRVKVLNGLHFNKRIQVIFMPKGPEGVSKITPCRIQYEPLNIKIIIYKSTTKPRLRHRE